MTVNVNFPESAVQKATDDYVKELYKTKEKGKGGGATEGAPAAEFRNLWGIRETWAAEFEFVTVTAGTQAITRAKIAPLLKDVDAQKAAGLLGEGNDGFVAVPPAARAGLKPALTQKLEGLAKAMNAARRELYDQVMKDNPNLPSGRRKDVEKSFARSFAGDAASPAGTWVQDAEGNWAKK